MRVLTALKRGQTVWYVHSQLVVSLVFPQGFQLPLFLHRIRSFSHLSLLNDQEWKQECELTAIQEVLPKLRAYFPKLKFKILLDALYANDSMFSLLQSLRLGFSIVRKKNVLKTVGQDLEGLSQLVDHLYHQSSSKRFVTHQTFQFYNAVSYKSHRLNIIDLHEVSQKKSSHRFAKIHTKISHWQWIVNDTLSIENTVSIASQSRLRWKQEDLFNSLENRKFAIRHDFARAPSSQSVWLYLLLIAFALDSLFFLFHLGQLAKQGRTIQALMQEMLTDLIYLPTDLLFNCLFPKNLRFYVVPSG